MLRLYRIILPAVYAYLMMNVLYSSLSGSYIPTFCTQMTHPGKSKLPQISLLYSTGNKWHRNVPLYSVNPDLHHQGHSVNAWYNFTGESWEASEGWKLPSLNRYTIIQKGDLYGVIPSHFRKLMTQHIDRGFHGQKDLKCHTSAK